MKKEKQRQAVAYLKEKKLEDLKDDLLIMKLPHLLSMQKVRFAILGIIDLVLFLLANLGTNVIKLTLGNIGNLLKGNDSPFGLLELFCFWNHSFAWYVVVMVMLVVVDVKVYFMICTNYRDINKNQKGSTRWSTMEEIREQYPVIPLKAERPYQTFYGKGGVPVCQHGTYYNEKQQLCGIDKGEIFIDRTPVNNLVLGITRSGKGEMFVFTIIDIYSRAENKWYTLNYMPETSGGAGFRITVADIYYDYREGGTEKHDIPEIIDAGTLAFGKTEFMNVLRLYEQEHKHKLQLPEGLELEDDYSFFDQIDGKEEGDNLITEMIAVSTADRVLPKKNTDKGIELKLLAAKICVTNKNTNESVEYHFKPDDAQSKRNALDQAFLYLSLLKTLLQERYEEYREAMGFFLKETEYRVSKCEDINISNAKKLASAVTSKDTLSLSGVFKDIPEEDILDGEMGADEQPEKTDFLKLLSETAEINHCKEFHFKRNYQASMVVSDPKLELFIASKPILELRGYDVYCLNLVNPYESSGYNPLQLITDTYKGGDPAEASAIARSLATAIFAGETEGSNENAFFYENAGFLTAALIMSEVIDELRADEEANKEYLQQHIEATLRFQKLPEEEKEAVLESGRKLESLKKKRYLENDTFEQVMLDRDIDRLKKELEPYNYKNEDFIPRNDNEKKINLPNVLLKFTMLAEKTVASEVEGAEPKNALDIFFQKRDSLDVARNLYSAIQIAGGERVKGSVYSTVLSKLTGFMDDKIKKMTAFSSFRLEHIGFGDKPVAVFMSLPDYDNSNAFIQSIFISQCYYALAKKATVNGGKCKREVIFLLDEFGNIPAIANMSSMITVCLGRNIRFNLVIQAYSQLKQIYGEHDSDTIYGNCGNQIYIQTDNLDTAKQYSEMIGKETITTVTRMGGEVSLTTQKQYTESVDEKPLLNENELMEFVEGECVVKRVMMRKDLINQKVKPRPIYNHGETAFPLRYQYLADWYNTENKWEDLHAESCAGLDLSEYVSDFDKLLEEIEYTMSDEYKMWYQMVTENYEENRNYPIGEFLNKDEIERKLLVQVGELRTMPKDKLHQLTISDIERYFIKYESNLPAFRRRMYEISDWARAVDKTLRSFHPDLIKFFRLALDKNADEVWEAYNLDDEDVLLDMTTEEMLEILEEQEIPESVIIQVKTALGKFEIKEGVTA